MLRKQKRQIPQETLAARYNWCEGPVPGRGLAVEKHSSIYTLWHASEKCDVIQFQLHEECEAQYEIIYTEKTISVETAYVTVHKTNVESYW
jgi:hypothetical protein